eukprot:TRINITY_DN18214_c0_g1_i1.p1 TRINITY_DN18214_c0_g1~~TRINITY_DN18214_c0_g1_i1.p1  ORF type:complete len:396 (+),score=105.86 TRINITY_DN18214_c0_g1_i1:69-1256(+)
MSAQKQIDNSNSNSNRYLLPSFNKTPEAPAAAPAPLPEEEPARPFHLSPSVGTWYLLPSFAPELPVVKEEPEQERVQKPFHLSPSVGTWYMMPSFASVQPQSEQLPVASAMPEETSVDEVVELLAREEMFDVFWAQLDEEEQEEKFSYQRAEVEARQAAFEQFWDEMHQEEQEEKSAFIEAELDARLRMFEDYWIEVDKHEEEEKAELLAPELEARRFEFESFWQRFDEEKANKEARMHKRSLKIQRQANQRVFGLTVRAPTELSEVSVQSPSEKALVGSPAHSLRRSKGFGSVTRSSSSSAMALDLGLPASPKGALPELKKPSTPSMGVRSASTGALGPLKSTIVGAGSIKSSVPSYLQAKPVANNWSVDHSLGMPRPTDRRIGWGLAPTPVGF